MSSSTYFRIIGYLVTIAMHVGNILSMNILVKGLLNIEPELKKFGNLQPRYFTCWTFFLQVFHAIVGLILDVLLIINAKDKLYKPPKYLKGFKDTLFSAVLWPSSWVVFSVFWSLYLYERSLIFPDYAYKVVTPLSNHIMHTAIIGVVLWEVIFQPRLKPRSHKRNLYHLVFHFLLYFVVLTYTYIEYDMWIYPIFTVLYGTKYFPILPTTIGVLAFGFYYIQWPITAFFWGSEQNLKKIT